MDWAESHWLWRERCYGRLSRCAQDALVRGVALALTDEINKALETLERVELRFPLAAKQALLYVHNQCQVVDSGAVAKLEGGMREERSKATGEDLYRTGVVLRLTGSPKSKVEDMLKRSLSNEPNNIKANTLLAWLLFETDPVKAKALFITGQKHDKDNYDAVIGEISCLGNNQSGIDRINQLLVRNPKSALPLVIRMRLHLASRDWELASESADRLLSLSNNNIHALHLKALKNIVEGKYENALEYVENLRKALKEEEPKSWWLYVKMSSSLARCSGSDKQLESAIQAICQEGVRIAPYLMEPLLESGYQAYITGDIDVAHKAYTAATTLDETCIEALIALTVLEAARTGFTPQVKQHTEFLMEVGGLEGRGKTLLEIVSAESSRDEEECVRLLNAAVARIQESAGKLPYGPDHLATLDPRLLTKIAHTYPKQRLKEKIKVLRLVVERVGGLREAKLSLCRCLMEAGEVDESAKVLQSLLLSDPTEYRAHLFMAHIHFYKENLDEAKASLELSLSYNLAVKDIASYHLCCGLIELSEGNGSIAVHSLRRAIDLHNGGDRGGGEALTTKEAGLAFRELATQLISEGNVNDAGEVLDRAEKELRGSGEEAGVLLTRAKLAAASGNPHHALHLLNEIHDNPHYVQAQLTKAEIYLKYMKDEHAYTDCYKKLADSYPTTEHFLMLGDAYLAIQESELAVENYERAMIGTSENPKLCCRLARVLVRCHQYAKAIKCYRDSGEEGCFELAELLLKLGQTDKAEAALSQVSLPEKVFVLAKVYEKGGKLEEAFNTLKKAEEECGRGESERQYRINEMMGRYASLMRNFEVAINCYKKALLRKPEHAPLQIALANLYMQLGDRSGCESVCSSLLRREEKNEEALLMLSDLALRRVDFATARTHLASLLSGRATNWVALVRLVHVLRRTARLEEAEEYLSAAAVHLPNAPGLLYARGLYYWYTGRTREAVETLNRVRGDPEWGAKAVHDLVEVVLGAGGSSDVGGLLAELDPTTPAEEAGLALLNAFASLSSDDPKQIERATLEFTRLANNDVHRVGATLGLATCYALQKQSARARAVLKRVAKATWSVEEAEHLEKAWLLLADLLTGAGGKTEAAQEVLARVVRHNRSSARAHELLGLIAEKDHKYYEASRCYEEAWKLGGESDPGLGYRLAYNLVKSKQYAEAISVGQIVLAGNPDYPRIKKDIVDKAMTHLRT